MNQTVSDIDEIIKATKHAGDQTASWQNVTPHEVRLKLPLWIDDAQYVGLSFVATATTKSVLQSGSLVLVLHDTAICRLNIFARQPHTNPPKTEPKKLRGISLPVNAHHWHLWEHNKRWPRTRDDKLKTACLCIEQLKTYQDAVNHFCSTMNIVAQIPDPPLEPTLGTL